ncbi:MAG: serine hydrolase [Lachnospiraceae bacterium]|nr:serine hydrolase [Lachnospiraceae bacterium]
MARAERRGAVCLFLALFLMLSLPGISCRTVRAEEAAAGEAAGDAEPAPPPPEVMPTNGVEGWPVSMDTTADYICLMDADTGAVLLEKGMDTETPPASLTKVLTTLLALEKGDPDAQVTMTQTGVAYAESGSSNLYTQVGEVFTLRDMLYGVMLKSANDMATQVGEYLGGGDIEVFFKMMNERAAAAGCTHSNFASACGMPNDAHYSSAHDMALITREALKNETFREIIHTKEYTIPATNLTAARTVANKQPFLVLDEWKYDGIIGGKSGYTDLARSCLITCVEQKGMTLIAVVMHDIDVSSERATTKQILDYGFQNFERVDTETPGPELISGGALTLPRGAKAGDCEASDSEEVLPDGTEAVVTDWTWHGRFVGRTVRSKAEIEKREKAESEAAEAEKRKAEEAALSKAEAEKRMAESREAEKAALSEAEAESRMTAESALPGTEAESGGTEEKGKTAGGAFALICALTVLILIGFILIILTLLIRGRRKKK